MATSEFELVPAEWPEKVPRTKKAILDFLASGMPVAEIKGDRDFLINVRRAAKSNKDFDAQVELQMVSNRMFIRRRENAS